MYHMYKSLKKGWYPYSELLKKYNPNVDHRRLIQRISEDSKEKLGRDWVVREDAFINLISDE